MTATYARSAGDTVTSASYAVTATLSPSGVLDNYNIIYNNAPFTITKRNAVVSPNSATKVYGATHPALTGSRSGFLAADGVTATYTRVAGETVAGGPYASSATLSPVAVLGNYNVTYNTAPFTITPATPAIVWNPAAAVYGAPLGAAQLNATTTIPGTWTYTPAAGTVLTAGAHILSVSFTPGDNSDYTTATQTATIKVQYSLNACLGDLGHSVLQPVNANSTSTFKQGSTVPVKFRVCYANGNSVGSAGIVSAFNLVSILNGTVTQTVDDTVASTTPDSMFRWDPTAQQWIFNISTKPLAVGRTYVYAIALNDGSTILFQYGLEIANLWRNWSFRAC